jgi:hypothetical protein
MRKDRASDLVKRQLQGMALPDMVPREKSKEACLVDHQALFGRKFEKSDDGELLNIKAAQCEDNRRVTCLLQFSCVDQRAEQASAGVKLAWDGTR